MLRLNKAIIAGNVGNSPESKYTSSGDAVLTFQVATNEGYYNKDQTWVEKTEWHNIVAYGNLAERMIEKLAKGMQVYIEGKIQTHSWEDNDGIKRKNTDIIARIIQINQKLEKEDSEL